MDQKAIDQIKRELQEQVRFLEEKVEAGELSIHDALWQMAGAAATMIAQRTRNTMTGGVHGPLS